MTTLLLSSALGPSDAAPGLAGGPGGLWAAVTVFVVMAVLTATAWSIARVQERRRSEKALNDQAAHFTAKIEELHARLGDIRTDSPEGQAVLARHRTEAEYAEVQLLIARSELAQRQADAAAIAAGKGTHRAELDALLGRKIALEIDLLTTQVELARRDLALRGDQLDYHDATLAKTRLEMESLKLHIREQSKRLDEI